METFAISREFTRNGISDLIVFASTLKTNLLAEPRFQSIQTFSDALVQASDALILADAKASSGSKADRVARDVRKIDLLAVLEKIALQVQLLATEEGDESLIYAAGFSLRAGRGPRSYTPLGAAEILTANRGKNSGTVVGRCRSIDGAVKFALEWSDDGGTSWNNGQYSQGFTFQLSGLAPEKRYWVRARPLGTNNRIGDWSQPVTLFVL